MTDRELLEMAAKAAGCKVRWHEPWGCFVHTVMINTTNPPTLAGQRHIWAPLDDDGDAYAATRRAITRAAAEIGRAMP